VHRGCAEKSARRLSRRGIREDDDEFVAAEAPDTVVRAKRVFDAVRDGFQDSVARGMAERVVDPL